MPKTDIYCNGEQETRVKVLTAILDAVHNDNTTCYVDDAMYDIHSVHSNDEIRIIEVSKYER